MKTINNYSEKLTIILSYFDLTLQMFTGQLKFLPFLYGFVNNEFFTINGNYLTLNYEHKFSPINITFKLNDTNERMTIYIHHKENNLPYIFSNHYMISICDEKNTLQLSFCVENFKNSTFRFRSNSELLIKNLFSMVYSFQPDIRKLSGKDEQFLKINNIEPMDKFFACNFSYYNNKDIAKIYYGEEEITFENFAQIIMCHLKIQKIKNIELQSSSLKPLQIDYSNEIIYTDKLKYIYLKPNGINKYNIFLDILREKGVYIKITRILILPPTIENIRYFYSDAHKFFFGDKWESYLKENEMILLEFKVSDDYSFDQWSCIKNEFRKRSGFDWTINVCHMAINKEEQEHFQWFFNQKINNKSINNPPIFFKKDIGEIEEHTLTKKRKLI